ncbi:hypothetical protein F1C16_07845 [Hymenobacter sp. NBH84]|uniref:Uncharacterized protein n=1 Tax=Hymenobacter defluvii TaxID=2054411 RepID=A0ABS3T916_9BACT|nr:Imm50 family immunity protein [Hymenobacter defluvii]MBO3269828.1 hypothetical protein [Hymenobacter defluvii]QNE39470.1 hypothetical protein F1C16_07845 [Hymenobacter sp. NBH84]
MSVVAEIENVHLITEYFGHWPSFHDAEIISVCFTRDVQAGWSTILMQLYVCEKWNESVNCGVVDLEFLRVHVSELDGFNHQNVIFNVELSKEAGLVQWQNTTSYGAEIFIAAEMIRVKSVRPKT